MFRLFANLDRRVWLASFGLLAAGGVVVALSFLSFSGEREPGSGERPPGPANSPLAAELEGGPVFAVAPVSLAPPAVDLLPPLAGWRLPLVAADGAPPGPPAADLLPPLTGPRLLLVAADRAPPAPDPLALVSAAAPEPFPVLHVPMVVREHDPEFLLLRDQLAVAIDAYQLPGSYAVAVTDLQTGHTISVNGERPQYSGCVANYFVLVSALRDVEAGEYELSRVESLIARTTWSSNATTARAIYEITGGGDSREGVRKVNAIAAELGLENVQLDHPPAYPAQSLGLDVSNWLTAEDMNGALGALYHGDLLGEEMRAHLLGALSQVTPGLNYLTASTPDAIVSHKNGFFPIPGGGWVDNDAGIVRFERNGQEYAYAVTFLSQDVPVRLGDITLGQNLMALTWDYFSARYP